MDATKTRITPVASRQETLFGLDIPDQLAPIADAIESSKRILDMPDDWDGEGSPAYLRETWERACRLLLTNAIALWCDDNTIISQPSILNGPQDSIDVYWTGPSTLLINVPVDADEEPTFYGKGSDGSELSGNIGANPEQKHLIKTILRGFVRSNG